MRRATTTARRRVVVLSAACLVAAACGSGKSALEAGNDDPPAPASAEAQPDVTVDGDPPGDGTIDVGREGTESTTGRATSTGGVTVLNSMHARSACLATKLLWDCQSSACRPHSLSM